MKTEEKIKYALDAYEVKRHENRYWYIASLYGTRLSGFRLEELQRLGLQVLSVEIEYNWYYDQHGDRDCDAKLFVIIRRKNKPKEGEKNG